MAPDFEPPRANASSCSRLRRLSLAALLILVTAVACSATAGSGAGGEGTDQGASAGASGVGGEPGGGRAGNQGGSSGGGGGFDVDASPPSPPPGCEPCSADLKKVLDCNGQVIKECGPGEACAAGICAKDPCAAASQAKSTYGCDYWTLNLDTIVSGSCYAVFVANTWTAPVHIQVERAGKAFQTATFARIPKGQGSSLSYAPYDAATGLPPGEVAILFLSHAPGFLMSVACPAGITPALTVSTQVLSTGRGDAFHISTDAPVVAYQIYPYGGGNVAQTSATLLLPTSAWDTNYIATSAYKKSQISSGLPSLDIVAAEDGTEVEISPVVAIQGGVGVPSTGAGKPIKYQLARGQYLQITQSEELTGSAVLANKPVWMFGGATCLNVPTNTAACDTAQQQIPPVKAMGNEYVAVRYRGRLKNGAPFDESVPWRLVGAVDGTALQYDPAPPPGAPASLAQGQVAELWSTGPFVVRSQDKDHPFYAAGYMTGCTYSNPNGTEGDAEWVNLIPLGQYLDYYVFFTDPTYPETNLVVVRKKGKSGQFADVELDCAGKLGGWQAIGEHQYTRVDLVTGMFQGVNGCGNGRHLMKSDAPFGLMVWGWGSELTWTPAVSYAYPAGASVQPINTVTVPPTPK